MGASFDTGNMGVSALAASLVNLVCQVRPDSEIFFFIGSRTSATQHVKLPTGIARVPIVNYRLSPRGPLQRHLLWLLFLATLQKTLPNKSVRSLIIRSNPCLKALIEADFIGAIHGGDSFSDIYGLGSFVLGCIPDIIVLLLGKGLVLLPQTYGPYKSRLARWFAKFIITRASLVLSRDCEGPGVVEGIGGKTFDAGRLRCCPDVAFSLAVARPPERAVDPPLSGEEIIGFNVSGLLYNGGYSRDNMFELKLDYKHFVHKLAEKMLVQTDAHLLLVPHTYALDGHVENDLDACRAVYDAIPVAYKGRVHLVTLKCDQSEIKGIIGECNMFVGSRMHACIAALSQGIPTVGVAYSKKFSGVFATVGVGDMVVDARSTDGEDAIRGIIAMYRDRKVTGVLLKEKVEAARKQLLAAFRDVIEMSEFK